MPKERNRLVLVVCSVARPVDLDVVRHALARARDAMAVIALPAFTTPTEQELKLEDVLLTHARPAPPLFTHTKAKSNRCIKCNSAMQRRCPRCGDKRYR